MRDHSILPRRLFITDRRREAAEWHGTSEITVIARVHYTHIKYYWAYHDRRFFCGVPFAWLSSCSFQVSPPTEVHGGFIEGNATIRRAGAVALVSDKRASRIDLRNRQDQNDNSNQSNVRAVKRKKKRVQEASSDIELLRRFKLIWYRLQQKGIPYWLIDACADYHGAHTPDRGCFRSLSIVPSVRHKASTAGVSHLAPVVRKPRPLPRRVSLDRTPASRIIVNVWVQLTIIFVADSSKLT